MEPNYFETRYVPHAGRAIVWKAICEYLQRFVAPTDTVIDIGAGYCDFINQISARVRYAIDVNPEAARCCAPGVTFLKVESIEQFDFAAGSVDVAMMSNVLEHLWPQQCSALFDRLDHLLTANGKVIVMQPNYFYAYRRYWDDFTHVRAFSHESLRDFLLSRGYRMLLFEKRFLPFSFKSRLPASYRLTKLYLASPWKPFAGQMLAVAQR